MTHAASWKLAKIWYVAHTDTGNNRYTIHSQIWVGAPQRKKIHITQYSLFYLCYMYGI